MIELPPGYEPFSDCIAHLWDDGRMLTLSSHTPDHSWDIVTTIKSNGTPMEASLQKYDASCSEKGEQCIRVTRIAINACLALVNFGCYREHLFPKEAQRDRHLAREQSERGRKAKARLSLAVEEVKFDQHVVLHRSHPDSEPGEPTGREREFGWVRGHWKMQTHGPGNSLRKRILVKPYMVRADKLVVPLHETSAEYKTGNSEENSANPLHQSRRRRDVQPRLPSWLGGRQPGLQSTKGEGAIDE
jgi:hypothetical protein